MILVADSGSSKTDWALIQKNNSVTYHKSSGINPFFHSSDDILKILQQTFIDAKISDNVKKVYFYGAGCVKNLNANIVVSGLERFFQHATEVLVEDDMLGAARSIFGNNSGIACILGTGANSCKYNGTSIVEKIPTLGYILGDEASGAYFGKILINNYFKKMMPDDLNEKFKTQYQPIVSEVLNKVYKEPYPNRFLAKFTYFLSENIEHQYTQNLLKKGFEAFISSNISKYVDYKVFSVGFVGSIAYHFSKSLIETCENHGISIDQIVDKPIVGLIQFHLKNN